MRLLGQLVRWCALMAILGFLLIIILESVRSEEAVEDLGGYMALIASLGNQLAGYSIIVFGFSLMLLVRISCSHSKCELY